MSAPLSQIPADLVSLSDYERHARQHLPHGLFEYIAGGGADELTLQRNRTTLDRISLLPRILQDATGGSTATRLLDESLRHPILLAPVAFQRLVHPDGELATARAADALDTTMVVSTLASQSLEDIAAQTQAGKWFQLYFQQDADFTLSLVRRAERAGYSKLVVTVDAQRVADMGLAGIIVSNHGGRALDCVPSAIEMLPQIRAATGSDFTLLLDGGISRGTDVFKALALGANAVLIGRPQLYALAVAGAVGVAHMLRVLREELEVCMALAGTPALDDITPASLYQGAF